MVYLKLQPYRQHTMHQHPFHKLSAKYYGPFEVGEGVSVEPQPPAVTDSSRPIWTPAKVLQTRLVKHKGEAATQWLVQLMESTPEEATWEYAQDIQRRFPDFDSDA
ncbi:hypothetical protein ACLB2K_041136 [Fragaria x ananassa]